MEEIDRYYQGNITLEDAENYIASGLVTAARVYVANGYYLRRIRDDKLYEEAGYSDLDLKLITLFTRKRQKKCFVQTNNKRKKRMFLGDLSVVKFRG